jgi:manganese transport protein
MGCFGLEIALAHPQTLPLLAGFIPQKTLLQDPKMLYLAIGILGATVMPHNLYLHSAIVQTRHYEESIEGKKEAIRFAAIDSTLALGIAFFINSAILVVSAAVFYHHGLHQVTEIQDAYHLLTPLLGTTIASIIFGIALLMSGQNSTITGTLAGQIIMEGFIQLRLSPWKRRLITRLLAILPAIGVILYFGETSLGSLLIFSQVVLSLQLSFAVFPLIRFTSSPEKMGPFTNSNGLKILAYFIAYIITALNVGMILYNAIH